MAQSVEELVTTAATHHSQGRLGEAESCYRRALESDGDFLLASQGLALLLLQRRRVTEGIALLAQALERYPEDTELTCNLAAALASTGRLEEAVAAYRRALTLSPDDTATLSNLGYILNAQQRNAEAIECLQRAVTLAPDSVEANINLGIALKDASRLDEAMAIAEKIVSDHRNLAEGYNFLALVLERLGRQDEAIAAFEHALALRPDYIQALNNLGRAQLASGHHAEAAEYYRRSLMLQPAAIVAHYNYAVALSELGSHFEAVRHCRAVLERDPRHAGAWNALGRALDRLGRPADALVAFERAIAVAPAHAPALAGKGRTLAALDRPEEAHAAFALALTLNSELGQAAGDDFLTAAVQCDWRDFADKRGDIAARCRKGETIEPSAVLRAIDDPALHLAVAARVAPPVRRAKALRPAKPRMRLRIAYLSAGFHGHPADRIAALLERHDHSRFETFGICHHPNPPEDDTRQRLARGFDHFVVAGQYSDEGIATLLANRQIDIAIDLDGHGRFGRPGIFSFRPAPLSVSYLGHHGGTGAPYYDYLIADTLTVPESCEGDYAEKIVRLPSSTIPIDVPAKVPICTRAETGLPERGFVFCAFAEPDMLSPDVFAIWMRLLAEGDSVLWLNVHAPAAQANLRAEAAAAGIAPERLIFAEPTNDRAYHLARLACADLCLDTYPFGAHVAASDGLSAGAPVLTRIGRGAAARTTAAILHALGLDALIADSADTYEAAARNICADPRQLADLRARISEPQRRATLFDIDRLCRDLETAYRTMWDIKASGQPTHCFSVQANG